MSYDKALVVFAKNPELGKVKTRLAAQTSDDYALNIYKQLLQHTSEISRHIDGTVLVFYADDIPVNDRLFPHAERRLQHGSDLGERMQHAFQSTIENSYQRVVIIGSDCATLSSTHLNQAFHALEQHDIVIGPAQDGGYYLIGMKNLQSDLFNDISWSTNKVLQQTLEKINRLQLSFELLETLSDIDEAKDLTTLPSHWKLP